MPERPSESPRTAATREKFRVAAKRLFLDRGYLGTSTDAILAEAAVASKETLYRHYPTKEALFVDVLRSMTTENASLSQFFDREPTPRTVSDLRTLLRELVTELMETMLQEEYLALIRVIIAELPRFPELGPLFRQTVPDRALAWLVTLLASGRREGIVREDRELSTAARMLLGTLLTYALFDGLFSRGVRPGAPRPPAPGKETLNEIVENLIDAVTVRDGNPAQERNSHHGY